MKSFLNRDKEVFALFGFIVILGVVLKLVWIGLTTEISEPQQVSVATTACILPTWDRNSRGSAVSRTTQHQLKAYALGAAVTQARTRQDSLVKFVQLVESKDSVIKAVEAERDSLLSLLADSNWCK